jgi:hypothetical protein
VRVVNSVTTVPSNELYKQGSIPGSSRKQNIIEFLLKGIIIIQVRLFNSALPEIQRVAGRRINRALFGPRFRKEQFEIVNQSNKHLTRREVT